MVKEIIDTTLRDGEQAPGINFSIKQKWDLALNLMELGLDEIEAGIPIMGQSQVDFISSLVSVNNLTKISAWSRLKLSDVKTTQKTGVDIIHISLPISGFHLPNQLGTWKKLLSDFDEVINYAKSNFKYVSVGLQDSFRTDPKRLYELCHLAEEHKLYRVRFSDTVGGAFPNDVNGLISRARGIFSGKIDFHGHNDLGLASANSLTALLSGADSVNTTINGIGERAGNASFEQLVFIIDQHPKLESRIKIEGIKKICTKVSEYSLRELSLDKPIVGANVFTHESGIHCHGTLSNPLAYLPFKPEEKGLPKTNIVVGTHSGKSNVMQILDNIGINSRGQDMTKIMNLFKDVAEKKHNYLTTDEVIQIYKKEMRGLI